MARKWWALLTICMGMLMLLVDVTIVNVALPSMATDLHASFSDLQWTIDAYALSLAALLLVAGSLGDLLGHRLIFGLGLLVFSTASLLCGVAPDALFLIICRAVQGVGGAAMYAASLALLANEFRGRERGIALGIWGATAGASIAVGPLIGGALTSGISWRWVFYVNVPVGAATLILLAIKVAETRRRRVSPDWTGALLFACSLFGLVFGLIRGNADGWSSTKVLASFAAGGVLLALFVLVEAKRRQPMLELGLFRNRTFLGTSIAAVSLAGSLFALFLYLTLYLQDILHYSPFQAGLRFLPATLMVLVAAPIAGRLTAHVPLKLLLGAGLTLTAIGLGLMTEVSPDSSWTALLAGFVVAGAGSGLTNPPRAAAAIGSVPEQKAGVASGVNNTALQVGLAAGIAALGAIFQSRVHDALSGNLDRTLPQLGTRRAEIVHQVTTGDAASALGSLPPALREPVAAAVRASFVTGLDRILWIAAAVSLVGAVASLVLVRQHDLEHAEEPLPPVAEPSLAEGR